MNALKQFTNIESKFGRAIAAGKTSLDDVHKLMDEDRITETGSYQTSKGVVAIIPANLPDKMKVSRNKIVFAYAIMMGNGIPQSLAAREKIKMRRVETKKNAVETLKNAFPSAVSEGVVNFYNIPQDYSEMRFGVLRPSDLCKTTLPEVTNAWNSLVGYQMIENVAETHRLHVPQRPFYTVTGRCQPSSDLEFGCSPFLLPRIMRNEILNVFDLYEVDVAGFEIGVSAGIYHDQGLTEDYLSGDPYIQFANENSIERSVAKTCILGIMKGMTKFTLAKLIGSSKARAQELIDAWFKRYPRYKMMILEDAGFVFDRDTMSHKKGPTGIVLNRNKIICTRYLGFSNESVVKMQEFNKRKNSALAFRSQAVASEILYSVVVKGIREQLPLVGSLHDSIYVTGYDNALRVSQLFEEQSKAMIGIPLRTIITHLYNPEF